MKIYAVPYAVGNTRIYYNLKKELNSNIHFIALELPGHGYRLDEPLLESIDEMSEDIYKQILHNGLDEDYCLFGYSMGSAVCYETYYKLLENKCRLPQRIFLCACPSPEHNYINKNIRHCSREDLINILKKYGGTSEELFQHDSFLDFLLPLVRADFVAVEEYRAMKKNEKIQSKGIIIYSEEEEERIERWRDSFENECFFYKVNDGHFFIHKHYDVITNIIKRNIR